MKPPIVNLDIKSFWENPYLALATMRQETPICYVSELQAILLTRHDDISKCEKMVDVFSSDQPAGLMNLLVGKNMMRKDGREHFQREYIMISKKKNDNT